MSAGYRAVQWSPGKRAYDSTLGALLATYLLVFLGVSWLVRPEITIETALIRAFGTAALLLLHVVLAIGPLARIDRRFLPLLWNRRHLGVTMFLTALAHGSLALVQFHFLGDRNPLVSLLSTSHRFGSLAQFPFQPLGFAALVVLFLMAATSHDFWLANLTAPVWKALHMGVYLAYALVIAHVALGALQDERSPWLTAALGCGLVMILGLHLAAALRESRTDRAAASATANGFVEVGRVDEIPEGRAKVVFAGGERVAIFRYEGKLSAISNVCQHQNGPLGEGRILDGCVTCPWHGYQYRPADGASPAPFTEKVPTFRLRLAGERILLDPRPLAPGTPVEPATFDPALPSPPDREAFFVGYLPLPAPLAVFLRRAVATLALAFVVLAGVVAAQQRALGSGEYDYGVDSTIEGVLRLRPLPAIWSLPASSDQAVAGGAAGGPVSIVPLVGVGKHGVAEAVAALDGRAVRASGSWIRRGRETLFEVAGARAVERPQGETGGDSAPSAIASARLRGEIVDSKCYLGVMKPGEGKSHKACAILCISGGSPAALVVRTPAGETALLWLVSADGRPLGRELLDLVAEPVEVEGELVRLGSRVLLVTERARIRRLEPTAS